MVELEEVDEEVVEEVEKEVKVKTQENLHLQSLRISHNIHDITSIKVSAFDLNIRLKTWVIAGRYCVEKYQNKGLYNL